MSKLNLECFGIEINFDESDIGGACISSDMHETQNNENIAFNAAVDGLESIILAHFCAGVDVGSPSYVEGIETAYHAIGDNIDGAKNQENLGEYYQPKLSDAQWERGSLASFEVYGDIENAKSDYPSSDILTFSGDDIENPSFVDGE